MLDTHPTKKEIPTQCLPGSEKRAVHRLSDEFELNESLAYDTIVKHWDARADSFDADHDTEHIDKWMSVLSDLLGTDTNRNVLDLGAGTGFLANMISRLGFPTVAADISVKMMELGVRHALQTNSSAMYLKADALHLPLMDNTVDVIVNSRLIWTVYNPKKALAEWFRVLKPQGGLFCFNRMKPHEGLGENNYGVYGNEVDAGLTLCHMDMDEMVQTVQDAGFEKVRVQCFPGLTRKEFDLDDWYALIGYKPCTS